MSDRAQHAQVRGLIAGELSDEGRAAQHLGRVNDPQAAGGNVQNGHGLGLAVGFAELDLNLPVIGKPSERRSS